MCFVLALAPDASPQQAECHLVGRAAPCAMMEDSQESRHCCACTRMHNLLVMCSGSGTWSQCACKSFRKGVRDVVIFHCGDKLTRIIVIDSSTGNSGMPI